MSWWIGKTTRAAFNAAVSEHEFREDRTAYVKGDGAVPQPAPTQAPISTFRTTSAAPPARRASTRSR